VKKAIILVSGLFLTNVMYGSTESILTHPKKEHVERYKKEIRSNCKKGVVMKVGLMGTSFAALSYAVYTMFLKKKLKHYKLPALDNQQLTDKVRRLEMKLKKQLSASWFSQKWLKKISSGVLNTLLSTVTGSFLGSALNKAFASYDCFSDIDLFLKKRLSGLSVLDELIYNAKIVDVAKQERCKSLSGKRDRFIVACQNVVPFVEQVIAFMEYKIDQFANNMVSLSKEEKAIPVYLFDCTQDFCQKIESYLIGKETNDSFMFLAAEFKEEVARCVKSFKYLETRVSWT